MPIGPDPATRQELHLTPLLLLNAIITLTAYATVNPRLFPFRLWLVPFALASAWHLCTDFALSDPWLNTFNFGTCAIGFTIFMKLVEITFLEKPPTYDGKPGCGKHDILCVNCLVNTVGYLFDIRCLHWNNDSPCFTPHDTRGSSSRLQFYTDTLYRLVKHLLVYDTCHAIIENIGGLGTPQGDTIFRSSLTITPTLKLHLPYPVLTAVPITFLVGLVIWNSMSAMHYLCTLLFAPLTSYSLSPTQLKREWPPLFDNPLTATSLRNFWSRRWHSVFRRNFWVAGGKPGCVLGGYVGALVGASTAGMRVGGVMGVFLLSGLLHDLGMWGMGQGVDFRRVTGYFLLQGVGLILENVLGLDKLDDKSEARNDAAEKHVNDNANGSATNANQTPSGSQHRLMTLWVFAWVVLPAMMMAEAWLERGLAGVVIWPHTLSPARAAFGVWNRLIFQ